jgi:hypothetical protein
MGDKREPKETREEKEKKKKWTIRKIRKGRGKAKNLGEKIEEKEDMRRRINGENMEEKNKWEKEKKTK